MGQNVKKLCLVFFREFFFTLFEIFERGHSELYIDII